VDRVACVELRRLPLQILLRAHPDWRELPTVVVDRDKPNGVIEWANEQARACRVLPGMRYAGGLALTHELRAGVVTKAMMQDVLIRLMRRLTRYSPQIESSSEEPGVFWLNASGLGRLYPSLMDWADCIQDDLWRAGYSAVVVVGFSKYATYAAAVARKEGRNLVFADSAQEQEHLQTVPLDRLGLARQLRDALLKLGVRTSGGFLALPAESVRKRFGEEAHELHRQVGNRDWIPLKPVDLPEPIAHKTVLDYAETSHERLLNLAEPLLIIMLESLAKRREALAELRLRLELDDKGRHVETLEPASPTLDAGQLRHLLRLRLEARTISAGVIELHLQAKGTPATQRQLELFREKPKRDFSAIQRALARIRAELGNDAVESARLVDGHLPEAQFSLTPMKELPRSRPRETKTAPRPLARRILLPVVGLPSRARHEPDGWLLGDLADGPVEETHGPHVVSGGWWAKEVVRVYYYARTRSGRWLWVYLDQRRRRWFLQGEVE
jgi:protein ImuB